MSARPHPALAGLAQPVECRQLTIRAGLAPATSKNIRAALIRDGRGVLVGEFSATNISTGDLVIVAPDTCCGFVSATPTDIAVAFLNPSFVDQQLRWGRSAHESSSNSGISLGQCDDSTRVIRLDSDIFEELVLHVAGIADRSAGTPSPGEHVARATRLVHSLEALLRESHPRQSVAVPSVREPLRREVGDVIALMHEQYGSQLLLSDLARHVWMSESALRRAFRAATGMTPRTYLHRLRLSRYARIVGETAIPLADAARLVGWSSTSYARKAFIKSYRTTPREYRAKTFVEVRTFEA